MACAHNALEVPVRIVKQAHTVIWVFFLRVSWQQAHDGRQRRGRYRLMRGFLRSRQPAAGTAIRAREPAAVPGGT